MEKFDSITHFLQSGEFEFRVFDLGRKVWGISNDLFARIENQEEQYPYPFQQKAWLALLFWQEGKQQEAVIWFLQFPVDEMGYLKQASRDAFLIDLLEQTGKNIQAKQRGEKTEDALGESPFAFKPREDRLAMFHAFATVILEQNPSSHYQYAHDYLQTKEEGGPGFEQWQFLGLQGIADVVARLGDDANEALLANAISELPSVPLSTYAQALENVEFGQGLFAALQDRVCKELSEIEATPIDEVDASKIALVASLLRAVASYPECKPKAKLLIDVLSVDKVGGSVEVLAAVSGRSWQSLKNTAVMRCFVAKLALQGQQAFSAIVADLMMMPEMRNLLLAEMRSEHRSAELASKFGLFMQGVVD